MFRTYLKTRASLDCFSASVILVFVASNLTLYTGEVEEGEPGPGQTFAPFLAMEDLLDKLKLLNYEKELVLKMRMRPINRQAAHFDNNSITSIQTLLHDPDKLWRAVLHLHLRHLLSRRQALRVWKGAAASPN